MTKKNAPKVRQFIVDAETVDGDGTDIMDEQFGSGGARRADGTLINQYKNPRPYDPDGADDDREFDAWLMTESRARTRREDGESQAAYDRRVQQTADAIMWVCREILAPIAKAYWDARGKDDLKRLKDWVSSRVRRGSSPSVAETEVSKAEPPSEILLEPIEVPEGIINLIEYRERRSAASLESESTAPGTATTA